MVRLVDALLTGMQAVASFGHEVRTSYYLNLAPLVDQGDSGRPILEAPHRAGNLLTLVGIFTGFPHVVADGKSRSENRNKRPYLSPEVKKLFPHRENLSPLCYGLASTESLKFVGHNKNVFKEKSCEVNDFLRFLFSSSGFMSAFVSQNSYGMCPLSHRLGDNAFLDKLVYSLKKPDSFLLEQVLNRKLKSGSASYDGKVVALLSEPETLLSPHKCLVYLFGNGHVRENFGNFGKYLVDTYFIRTAGGNLLTQSEKIVRGLVCKADDGRIAHGALGKYRNLVSVGRLNVKNTRIYGHYFYSVEPHFFEAMGTNSAKNEHLKTPLRRYYRWN